jgi:hypothetical protein
LYFIIWGTVRQLKEIGLDVVVVVADEISNNRTYFKLHKDEKLMKGGVVYKTVNRYDPSKYAYEYSYLISSMI